MNKTQPLRQRQASAEWSNRILLLSLLGIAYLTLFPFRFHYIPASRFDRSPFLLGYSGKTGNYVDFFLNVLLFVPFGVGVVAQARKRFFGRWTALVLALAAGACVSYSVELLQLYTAERSSGWDDVASNTLGSVVGGLLLEYCSTGLLARLSKWEDAIGSWLSLRSALLILVVYFGAWFGLSARLQQETRLSNWDSQCVLNVGNDAAGQNPWNGQVRAVQIWDRALPERQIQQIAARQPAPDASAGLLGSYDFESSPPYTDQQKLLPELRWAADSPPAAAGAVSLDAEHWLTTKDPVQNLNDSIRTSNRFTVHIVCAPAGIAGARGRIVSLSQSVENVNFHMRQEGTTLVLYIRTPLAEKRGILAWYIPRIFQAGKVRDIIATYDGSNGYIYLDGVQVPRVYRLGPAAALFSGVFDIQSSDLDSYIVVYDTLMFLPAGVLIGIAARNWRAKRASVFWLLVVGWAIPAVLLEGFLAIEGGRSVWWVSIALSLFFGVAGMALVNADRLRCTTNNAELERGIAYKT